MKIKAIPHVLAGGPSRHAWEEAPDGTHVALPLDVSQVSDAVVEKVKAGIANEWRAIYADRHEGGPIGSLIARAAIAALAAALGEETT